MAYTVFLRFYFFYPQSFSFLFDRANPSTLQKEGRKQLTALLMIFFGGVGVFGATKQTENTTLAYNHQKTCSNISIYLELCFWPANKRKSNIHSLLYLFPCLDQFLRETSSSLAGKCSNTLSS